MVAVYLLGTVVIAYQPFVLAIGHHRYRLRTGYDVNPLSQCLYQILQTAKGREHLLGSQAVALALRLLGLSNGTTHKTAVVSL